MLDNKGFDLWTKDYDKSVEKSSNQYPFDGYYNALNHVYNSILNKKSKKILDVGFGNWLKNNEGNIVGICDFKIGDEVYLSLLMIDDKLNGKGLGTIIYNHLEEIFKSKNSKKIRIDVVYDYKENVLSFWEKQGFIPNEKIQLEWNGYKSKAIKMYKIITD